MYASLDRSDIAYSIRALARHVRGPTEDDDKAMKKLSRYLARFPQCQLQVETWQTKASGQEDAFHLEAWCDADLGRII